MKLSVKDLDECVKQEKTYRRSHERHTIRPRRYAFIPNEYTEILSFTTVLYFLFFSLLFYLTVERMRGAS